MLLGFFCDGIQSHSYAFVTEEEKKNITTLTETGHHHSSRNGFLLVLTDGHFFRVRSDSETKEFKATMWKMFSLCCPTRVNERKASSCVYVCLYGIVVCFCFPFCCFLLSNLYFIQKKCIYFCTFLLFFSRRFCVWCKWTWQVLWFVSRWADLSGLNRAHSTFKVYVYLKVKISLLLHIHQDLKSSGYRISAQKLF